MNIKITPSALEGSIRAIESKSEAHRLLICAALADRPTKIGCHEGSEDIEATINCLRALGAEIKEVEDGFIVAPGPVPRGKLTLNCAESGSTLRFLLPVSCALAAEADLVLTGRLPSRPIWPLSRELAAHGCSIEGEGEKTLRCSGKLKGGEFSLPGNISSQFISGLLMALPMVGEDSILRLENAPESGPYIEMTLDALERFGIKIKTDGLTFKIRAGQSYVSRDNVLVEGDWSNAAFWLAAGALGNGITCRNLNPRSKQGDRQILNLLEHFGAKTEQTGEGFNVSRGRLRGIEIDARNTPDLVPVLAVLGSVAEGRTLIYNAQRLRIKESDRLKTVTAMLKALGADIKERPDGLEIKGRKSLKGGVVCSFNDHRIAMAAAIASTVCEGEVVIKDSGAVNKSYRGFFRDFELLGGRTEVV